jgi:hypothetical protein
MKRLIKICGILLLSLILKAESCTEGGEMTSREKYIDLTTRQLKSLFQAETLRDFELEEFEKSSKQKLADFADYLKILTDSSLKQPFREKAGEMVQEIFISDSIPVSICIAQGKIITSDVVQLVQKGLNNKIPAIQIQYDSIRIEQSFQWNGQDHYCAVLSFIQRVNRMHDGQTLETSVRGKTDARIIRENKIIGPDTLSVWVLHLGKILVLSRNFVPLGEGGARRAGD